MAEEWLTIAELAKRLGLAENTARRYAGHFSEFLQGRQFGRTMKYTLSSVEAIARVSALYQQGLGTQEIQERLRGELPQMIDVREQTPAAQPPGIREEQLARLIEHVENQERFNQELLKRLEERDTYIDRSLRARDEKLMEALREIRDSRLAIAAAEDERKPWWKWW